MSRQLDRIEDAHASPDAPCEISLYASLIDQYGDYHPNKGRGGANGGGGAAAPDPGGRSGGGGERGTLGGASALVRGALVSCVSWREVASREEVASRSSRRFTPVTRS